MPSDTPRRTPGSVSKTPKSQQTTLTSFFTVPNKSQQGTPTHLPLKQSGATNGKGSFATSSPRVPTPTATTDASAPQDDEDDDAEIIPFRKRLRKRNSMVYAESDDEDVENRITDQPRSAKRNGGTAKRLRVSKDDEDDKDWDAGKDEDMDLIADDALYDMMDVVEASGIVDEDNDEAVVPSRASQPSAAFTPYKASTQSTSTGSAAPTPNSSSSRLKQFSLAPKTLRKSSIVSSPLDTDKKQTRAQKFKEKNDERYSWLLNPKDAEGRSPTDEDYDPRTLLVPREAWKNFTPFEKQFWEIKANHWDTVVFFKKGKFFELYEKDADIGHQHFDLKLTDRVNMRMVGVPESSFDHWAAQFLAKGYKVAKVDQTETAVGKAMRDRDNSATSHLGKKSAPEEKTKVINRELTCILTTGTLIDSGLLTNDMGTYCMAIKEVQEAEHLPPSFGVAFVDTATAEFSFCAFEDDVERTRLETLVMQLKPRELVLEKGRFSKPSMRLLKNNLQNLAINFLIPEKEFYTAEYALDELRARNYFQNEADWPKAIDMARPLAREAFGGLLSYLRTLMIDRQLVSARNFHIYDPIRQSGSLILDGQTLINLEIFENTHDGSDTGTLHKLLNHAETPFGKRLFKKWVCHPLRDVRRIEDRLDASEDLNAVPGQLEKVEGDLRGLPDLERVISRIHAGSVRVREFVAALAAFRTIGEMMEDMQTYLPSFRSKQLHSIFENALPAHLVESLNYFADAFDHRKATESDLIHLHRGYDEEFDQACEAIEAVEAKLERHRVECERTLKCKIVFKDMGKELFQMEMPKKVNVPRDWQIKSNTAAVSRWWSPRGEELVREFLEAREVRDAAVRNVKARLCKRFDEHYQDWLRVVGKIAELDCLISLARCARFVGEPMCRPEFVEMEENGNGGSGPLLEIDEMRHPCITTGPGSSKIDFIPNDLHFGAGATGDDPSTATSKPNMVLLTGPNMGGKSTLLRQTCIAVIMAQLGCHVPARRCRLTVFDRIFTRLGANDKILAGQSTFMVELAETCKIMKEATPRSLVILDELGRGTSTFDGYAIAYAVLHHLVTRVRCLGLFSTHYRQLTTEFAANPLVAMMYMGYMTDEEKREVVFLYKLTRGTCPKSYGMNVASMAGVPEGIVRRAEEVARGFSGLKEVKGAGVAGRGTRGDVVRLANFADLVRVAGAGGGEAKGVVPPKCVVDTIWRSLQSGTA
ncbi:DNA mismatch repair protein msh6 [Fimicolochytrium jonesii]|uniref:DNA mismatch repair protein msh6 n=1 Tax=Fimicolochytrium jonesii TaxID=1396493 RepID=UPI0022FE0786|nr:DNA mismatch repair protein msh6 [Fimicolochytrium jonesii]KAI8824787.1 DNA mismatch repair protein msh6 [Fimicolochytrium jonesii]